MTTTRLLRVMLLCPLLLIMQLSWGQNKSISGKVTDDKGGPVVGASVLVKGTTKGTTTDAGGTFTISVPGSAKTLTIKSVGFVSQDVDISGKTSVTVSLVASDQNLNAIVVIGYGSVRNKDLTGSVTSVRSKDFDKGVTTPEELLIGKVAGLQVADNSGQPGGTTITKIRGNNSIVSGNNPLYVIDGVPIDATSPIPPNLLSVTGVTVSNNPLLFLNPGDISDITVLKDASAAAIYGARGENGVILITTNRGSGRMQVDAGVTVSTYAGLMKAPNNLSASQYRSELAVYGGKSDSGLSLNPFNQILQNKTSSKYFVALSGGGDNGKFRASFSANDQQGLIIKSGLQQYNASFSGDHSFLNKKLLINFNVIASNYTLQVAPIGTNSGSQGNLIEAALNWNPTLALVENGTFNQSNPSGQINPLALSAYTDDYANVTQIFANAGVTYKIIPHLTYNFLYGLDYATATRNAQIQGLISATGTNYDGHGGGQVSSGKISTQSITHTLTYDNEFKNGLNLNFLVGYEYYQQSNFSYNATTDFDYNYNVPGGPSYPNIPYYNDMQAGNKANLSVVTSDPPGSELESYFARGELNYKEKYFLTATIRDDGSSKFGSDNRYGYFPSFAAKWNILSESFMKKSTLFNTLGLRVGYGQTGGQDGLQPGTSQQLAQITGYNSSSNAAPPTTVLNYASPNLKWETLASLDAGIDYGFLNNRIFGSIDYFSKKTTNPLFPGTLPVPSSGATIWQNLPGYITNKGAEISVTAAVIRNKSFSWTVNVNVTYVRNKFIYPALGTSPLFLTGSVNGQGVSSAFCEALANNEPIDVFYLRQFTGFNSQGIAQVASQASGYAGDPNPHVILGFNNDFTYKRFSLSINTHGTFGSKIFDNTLVSVLNLGNITNGKNIAKTLIGSPESLANPVSASTRFLESGDYVKMGNVTLSYSIGNIGKNAVKNARIFVTGANLFEITKYNGFDAEVNQDHNNNGIPSLGIDYIGYPTARVITFGLNFSLY